MTHRHVAAGVGVVGALAIATVALVDGAPDVTPETLARSLTQRMTVVDGSASCRHVAGADWRCSVFTGSDGARYRLTVGDDRCWDARAIRPARGFPTSRSGCVR